VIVAHLSSPVPFMVLQEVKSMRGFGQDTVSGEGGVWKELKGSRIEPSSSGIYGFLEIPEGSRVVVTVPLPILADIEAVGAGVRLDQQEMIALDLDLLVRKQKTTSRYL